MATISVTSTPVQIDDGTGVELQITNTGTADVRVGKGTTGKRGQTVRPGGFLRFEPEGSAVYAASDSASSLTVVTSTAPVLTNLSATVAANTAALAALSFSAINGPQVVDRSGATNTAVALQAALNAAAAVVRTHQRSAAADATTLPVTATFEIPDGEYLVNSGLVWPQGLSLKLGPAAKIKAGATMTSLLSADPAVLHQRERVDGGRLDCNGLAAAAITLGYAVACTLDNIEVHDPTGHAIILGDDTAAASSYEMLVRNVSLWRPRGTTPPAGKAMLQMKRCGDSVTENVVGRGFDIGILTEAASGNNTHRAAHVWNPTGATGPTTCFDDYAAGTVYDTCYADSPSGFGWQLRNDHYTLIAPRAYMNAGGVDNTAVAIRLTGSPNVRVLGGAIRSESSSVRWKTDIDAPGGGFTKLLWGARSSETGIVTRTFGDRTVMPGLYLVGDPNVVPYQIQTGNVDALQVYVAGVLKGRITKDGWLADPFGLEFPTTVPFPSALATSTWLTANDAFYGRVVGSGTISKVRIHVITSSGNICVAAYSGTGSGASRVPGTLLASSGSVACPAAGVADVNLGASVTLNTGDFLAVACDNATAAIQSIGGGATTLWDGISYRQATAFPLPSTPSGLIASAQRVPVMRGV